MAALVTTGIPIPFLPSPMQHNTIIVCLVEEEWWAQRHFRNLGTALKRTVCLCWMLSGPSQAYLSKDLCNRSRTRSRHVQDSSLHTEDWSPLAPLLCLVQIHLSWIKMKFQILLITTIDHREKV